MKNYITILFILSASISYLFAQYPIIPTIDNKGNRTQTYPNVTTINSDIQELLDKVSITNLEDNIRYMQNLGNRDAQSPAALQTQNWLVDKFESLGLDVSVHHFTSSNYPANGDTLQAGNVVAIKQGVEFPEQYIIITSHYDSYLGPGADDNASGTAGVIECARILSQVQTKRSIIFVPFNAEEYHLHGSFPFAIKCAQENMNILGVFCLDMIGFYPSTGYGDIKMYTGHTILNQKLFEYYVQVANLYIPNVPTLRFSSDDCYGSDHKAFLLNDYPGLYIGDIEYANPCYHKPCDTIGEFGGVNNLNLAEAFVKATIAATAELADGWLPPQNFSAVSGIDNVTLSWDDMPETSKYKLYKNDVLLTETTSNSYIDNNVVLGETYAYYAKGFHSDTNEESNSSNIDSIVFSSPLTIPYTLDLEGDKEELKYWYYKDWRVGTQQKLKYLAPFHPNYSIMELDWFFIPEDTPDISLCITAKNNKPLGSMESLHGFIEVTTDRKTWHKLAKNIDFKVSSIYPPDTLVISLNEFVSSSFFQLRIRVGAIGNKYDAGVINLFSMSIDNTPVSIKENKITYFKNLQIFPNPSSGIVAIKTESESSYALAVYDISGKKVLQRNVFQDGILDLTALSKGTYLIQVSQDNHQIAKKVVVQ